MKNVIIALAFLFVASISHAQTNKDLQGPAAKNHKPWIGKTNATTPAIVITDYSKRLQGPAAKNHKPWMGNKSKKYTLIQTTDKNIRLKGPKAKNHKPWMKVPKKTDPIVHNSTKPETPSRVTKNTKSWTDKRP